MPEEKTQNPTLKSCPRYIQMCNVLTDYVNGNPEEPLSPIDFINFIEKKSRVDAYSFVFVAKVMAEYIDHTRAFTIDWSQIPEGYDWVAMDKCGPWYAYKALPAIRDGVWWFAGPRKSKHIELPEHPDGWKNSLMKRPG